MRKPRIRVVGSRNAPKNKPIPGAVIIKSNPQSIAKMNAELRKKCEAQRRDEAIAEILAGQFWVL